MWEIWDHGSGAPSLNSKLWVFEGAWGGALKLALKHLLNFRVISLPQREGQGITLSQK